MNTLGPLLDVRARPTVPFSPSWSVHPSVVVGTALFGALYFWAIGPLRRRLGEVPAGPWRVASFVSGLLVILGSLNGPIHDLSDFYLFSVHMAQHLLLTMVLPPFLIAGIPGWLVAHLVRNSSVRATARFVTRPLVAGTLFSATLILWHTVGAYDLMMRDHEIHVATHLMFMVVAVIMWWPVMSPSPSVPPIGYGMRMLYLFVIGLPMQLVAAIISLSDDLLYPWYQVAPRTWNLSALDDQKLGGLLMWVPGNMWLWGAMSVAFFRWAKHERKQEGMPKAVGEGGGNDVG